MSTHPSKAESLQFLKLGGSLITDKSKNSTPRMEVIARLAGEIAQALAARPDSRLVLGHGSGSFGHVPAEKYGTLKGVHTPEEWRGFGEVWYQAVFLNRLVMEALHQAGIAAVAFAASGSVTAQGGAIKEWNLHPLEAALQAGLLPVVYGDVAFDREWGGTILSTEDLFLYLAPRLHPQRILIAGIEPGVWADFPTCSTILPAITPAAFPRVSANVGGSTGTDVTGGMHSKVSQMIALVEKLPELEEVQIFSGREPLAVREALMGAHPGTKLYRGDQ